MAFQQPTRQPVYRAVCSSKTDQNDASIQPIVTSERPADETWVLFSPPAEGNTILSFSEGNKSLAGEKSSFSDLGSWKTATRADKTKGPSHVATATALGHDSIEDDAELDSLDSHLPEFQFRSILDVPAPAPAAGLPKPQPILPSHDGLGSFFLEQPTLRAVAKGEAGQSETPRGLRIGRRLDAFSRARLEVECGRIEEEEKRRRIEAWRLEHSRVLFDQELLPSMDIHRQDSAVIELGRAAWPEEELLEDKDCGEGFLAKLTRRVVQGLLGIDDELLSVLLGQTLVGANDRPTGPRSDEAISRTRDGDSWQLGLLERLSRELGLLVNRLSHHPGAFSAYVRMQQLTLPYAGLPAIPESSCAAHTNEGKTAETEEDEEAVEGEEIVIEGGDEDEDVEEEEEEEDEEEVEEKEKEKEKEATRCGQRRTGNRLLTTQQQHPHPWPVGRRHRVKETGEMMRAPKGREAPVFTKDEWEKELDVKLVFRYLVSRFSSGDEAASRSDGRSGVQGGQGQDRAAKAARVRRHHPLAGRLGPAERRSLRATVTTSSGALRRHSSCASQSTRRSGRRSSCSSRHYWDLGGSLGTGSVAATRGPMGSWAEV